MNQRNDYQQSNLDRRDFRHTKAGPETHRHRRKPIRNAGCKKNADQPHEYDKDLSTPTFQWMSLALYTCRHCGKHDWRTIEPTPPHH